MPYIISLLLHAIAFPIVVYLFSHGGHDLPVNPWIIIGPLIYIFLIIISIIIRSKFCSSYGYQDYIINFILIIITLGVSNSNGYGDITGQTIVKISFTSYYLFSTLMFLYFFWSRVFSPKKPWVGIFLVMVAISWMAYVFAGISFFLSHVYDNEYYKNEILPLNNVLINAIAQGTHKNPDELQQWYQQEEEYLYDHGYGFLSRYRFSRLGQFYYDAARENCTGIYACESHPYEYMQKTGFESKWEQYSQMINNFQAETCKKYSILFAHCNKD